MGKTLLTILIFCLFFTVHSFAQLPVKIDFENKDDWQLNIAVPALGASVPAQNFIIPDPTLLDLLPPELKAALSTEDNRWVINDIYNGGKVQALKIKLKNPQDPTQDITHEANFSDITNTSLQPAGFSFPNKNYLHTVSYYASTVSVPPILSAHYLKDLAFERKHFAMMKHDFNTLGFTNVSVNFWRVGGAGQSIYFSTDGGINWTLLTSITGSEKDWKNQTATHSGLNNQTKIRLGILWDDALATEDGTAIDEISITSTALVAAPIITSSVSASTVCVSATLPVTVSVAGTFNNGNLFTAQLSDATGSFASPRVIGSITGTANSTISATIPADLPEGNNYRLRVLSSNPVITSAASTQSLTVVALPARPQITVQGSTNLCPGNKVVLTASQASSYVWSTGATTQSIEVSQAGNYTVIVKNAASCESPASLAQTVTVSATIAQPVISVTGNTNLCQGQKALLTAPVADGYIWSTGATTRSIEVTQTGKFTLKVKNSTGCESAASAGVSITVHSSPAKPVITTGGPVSFCKGGSVTLTAPESAMYKWSTGATTRSITVGESGEYWLTTASAASCESIASDKIKVTVFDLPVTPVITATGNLTFCEGEKVLLTASEAISYLWSNGATTRSIEVAAAGTYTVRVSDANGCESAVSQPVEVNVVALPPKPVITLIGNSSICTGDSVTLTAPQSNTYLWSTGATTQSIVVKEEGSYSVTIKNVQGCESPLSDPVSIRVWQVPATPDIEQINLDTLTAKMPGTAYEWRKDGVVITSTTHKIKVSENGNYTVRIKDGNGCYSAFSPAYNFTIADKNLWNKISLFPNPSPGVFTLQIANSTTSTVQVQVLTLLGQQLQTFTYLNSAKDFHQLMDATRLTKGTYVLRIFMGEEVMYRKFVIQ
jgi:hypothetical protein